MDPVSAFGLAAGVLQVVDFSPRALKQCREIYKDGSLAEHRNTAEVVGHLGKCNKMDAVHRVYNRELSCGCS